MVDFAMNDDNKAKLPEALASLEEFRYRNLANTPPPIAAPP
jgi:hypothetical protein